MRESNASRKDEFSRKISSNTEKHRKSRSKIQDNRLDIVSTFSISALKLLFLGLSVSHSLCFNVC